MVKEVNQGKNAKMGRFIPQFRRGFALSGLIIVLLVSHQATLKLDMNGLTKMASRQQQQSVSSHDPNPNHKTKQNISLPGIEFEPARRMIGSEISTEEAIAKVQAAIENVEEQIEMVDKRLDAEGLSKEDVAHFRKEKEQLRQKEAHFRKEKEQLREKELLFLKHQLPQALERNAELDRKMDLLLEATPAPATDATVPAAKTTSTTAPAATSETKEQDSSKATVTKPEPSSTTTESVATSQATKLDDSMTPEWWATLSKKEQDKYNSSNPRFQRRWRKDNIGRKPKPGATVTTDNNSPAEGIRQGSTKTTTATATQCGIPENRTLMDASWLAFVKKNKWLPADTAKVPAEGELNDPALDCPSAQETALAWVHADQGVVSCPPNAAMWMFPQFSKHPAMSKEGSTKVRCSAEGRYTIPRGHGLLYGNQVRLRPSQNGQALERAKKTLEERAAAKKPPHILLYMLDAVSRPALHRSMKATVRSLEAAAQSHTNVFEFARHHSVGGSSIRNLTPMLSGLLLADMEKRAPNYEGWIFEELRRLGYITISNHNACHLGNETHGKSFNRHAPENYFPYQMEDVGCFTSFFCGLNKKHHHDLPHNITDGCRGALKTSLPLEQYLHTRADHADVPTFGFIHDYDLHVEELVQLNRLDQVKARILPMLQEVLHDTVVIFTSDHGSQQKIAATEQGALEYKLPLLYMFVPNELLGDNRGLKDALTLNQHVLTSPRDVHETMLHLAGGRGDDAWWNKQKQDAALQGGSSLLQPLAYNRSCDEAGIPAIECICGGSRPEELKEGSEAWKTVLRNYIPQLVKTMNEELNDKQLVGRVCRRLEADQLLYASKRPTTDKFTGYEVRFTVQAPNRTEPMEMFANFNVGRMHLKGFYVGTAIQTSRFAHWIEHCRDQVTAAGGNHHYCDCAQPPPAGWASIRPAARPA